MYLHKRSFMQSTGIMYVHVHNNGYSQNGFKQAYKVISAHTGQM